MPANISGEKSLLVELSSWRILALEDDDMGGLVKI